MEEKGKVITHKDVGIGLNIDNGSLAVKTDGVTITIEGGALVAKQGVDLRVKQIIGDQESGKLKVTVAGENGEGEQVVETSLAQLLALSRAADNLAKANEDGVFVGKSDVVDAVKEQIDNTTVSPNSRGQLSSTLKFSPNVRVVEAAAITHFMFRQALNSDQHTICTGFKAGGVWYGDRPQEGTYQDLFSGETLSHSGVDNETPALVAPVAPNQPTQPTDPAQPTEPTQPVAPTDKAGFIYTPGTNGSTLELVNWGDLQPALAIKEFDGLSYEPPLIGIPASKEQLSNGKYKFVYNLKPSTTRRDEYTGGNCDFTINGYQVNGNITPIYAEDGISHTGVFGVLGGDEASVISRLQNAFPSS